MSSCKWERKDVLPLIVTVLSCKNTRGRYTSVRLGMSIHHFRVDENHSQE